MMRLKMNKSYNIWNLESFAFISSSLLPWRFFPSLCCFICLFSLIYCRFSVFWNSSSFFVLKVCCCFPILCNFLSLSILSAAAASHCLLLFLLPFLSLKFSLLFPCSLLHWYCTQQNILWTSRWLFGLWVLDISLKMVSHLCKTINRFVGSAYKFFFLFSIFVFPRSKLSLDGL